MAQQDVRFTVPDYRLEDAPDAFDWELVGADGSLAGEGTTVNVNGSPLNGVRHMYVARLDLTLDGLDDGEYSLEISHEGNLLHTEPISVDNEESYKASDEYTLEGDDNVYVSTHPGLGLDTKWDLYERNDLLASGSGFAPGDDLRIDLSEFDSSLSPYLLLVEGSEGYTQHRLWRLTASVLGALKDLRTYTDRLNVDIRLDGLKFEESDYLHWLTMGRDSFNENTLTNFTMMDATGPIRKLWLSCSQYEALRTRYLEEGLNNFSYNGASVTLDVDVTQFLESQASTLETKIQEASQKLKINLHYKGLVAGPGKWTTRTSSYGATGHSLSPVMGRGGQLPHLWGARRANR